MRYSHEMTRRRFVGLGLAAGVCCGAHGGFAGGGSRSVRFGIVSDTHVTGEASIPELVRAFVFLREKGVDAVIHCGDMTDFGYIDQLEAFAAYRNAAVGPRLGANCNAVFTRAFPVSGARDVAYAERQQRRYFLTCQAEIGGAPATLVQTHLDLVEDLRSRQIACLMETFGAMPHVIVAGDFNISRTEEFAPFAAAGFQMANAAAFGLFRTHRRRDACYTTAIDNVLVKGFDILDAWTDDDPMFLSDHRILLCRLRPQLS